MQDFAELARAAKSAVVDASGLATALTRKLRGEVRFDNGSRALYATDGSNYRQVPIGVVIPRDADDVVATVALAREYGAPILCRGAGTSLAGQCCNVAVLLDFSKYMNKIIEIDPVRRIARVQPGVVLDNLRNAAEKHHLTFGPDPATHDRCTLGGMIGNNSCGAHSVMAGKTDDNIEELEILTYDGVRMKVGHTSEAEFENIIAAGSRRGEIYAGLRKLRDTYSDLIKQRYPQHSAASLRLQPELSSPRKRYQPGPRAGGIRGNLRNRPRSHMPLSRKPARTCAPPHRLSRYL